jgi:hypothetical protein
MMENKIDSRSVIIIVSIVCIAEYSYRGRKKWVTDFIPPLT